MNKISGMLDVVWKRNQDEAIKLSYLDSLVIISLQKTIDGVETKVSSERLSYEEYLKKYQFIHEQLVILDPLSEECDYTNELSNLVREETVLYYESLLKDQPHSEELIHELKVKDKIKEKIKEIK